MGIGLLNEATIRIKFDVDESELKNVKSAFASVSKALNLQKTIQDFNALEKVVERMEMELRDLNAENKRLGNDMASAVEAATKKITSATNRRLKSLDASNKKLREQIKSEREVAKATLATAVAEAKAAATAQKVAAAIKTLTAAERGQASQTALMAGKSDAYEKSLRETALMLAILSRASVAYAQRLREETAAKQKSLALRMDQKAKQEQMALDKLNQERQEAADKLKVQARYEQIMAAAVREGFSFFSKYGAAIQAVTKARNGDIKALNNYLDKLEQVISVERSRKNALKTGTFTNAAGEQQTMSLMDQVTNRISDAEKRVDALFRASYRLTMVGHTLRRFSQDIFRIGSDIMNTFGEFEFMLNRARGALSVFSGTMIEGHDGATLMRDGVLELTQQLKVFPAQDVAQALYFWGSTTGQVVNTVEKLNTAMSGLNPIMKTAAMTNTSYEQTIKGVYSILTQYFGGALERADEVTVQLFETTQRTAAEFTDLIQSFKMVGPVAAQAGASFEDVNATLGQLADLGIRGTMAGRGLRQFFIQMVRPSGPAQKALDKRFNELAASEADPFGGKSFFETAFPEGKFVGIEEHMRNLAIATDDLNEAEKNRLLSQISTANMLPLVIALVEEQRLGLHRLAGVTKDYTTDAEKAAEFFQKNWQLLDESWNALRGTIDRTVEAIRINIGTVMSTALRPFIEAIQDVLDKFNDFVRNNPAVVAALGKLVAALGAGAGLAGAVFVVLGALTGLGAAIALVVDAFGIWLKPILSTTTALGFLFTAIVDNFNYIKNSAVQIIDNLGAAFQNLGDDMSGIADMFVKITEPAREMVGIFVRIVTDIAVRVSELIESFSKLDFASDAVNALVMALGLLVSARIVTGILAVGAAFKTIIATRILGGLMAIVQTLGLMGKAIVSKGLVSGLRGVGGILSGLVGGPLGFAGLAIAGGFLAYDLFPPFKDAIDAVADAFGGLDAKIGDTVSNMGELGPKVEEAVIKFQGLRFDTTQVRAGIDKLGKERETLMEALDAQMLAPKNMKDAKKFWRGYFGPIFQEEGDFGTNLQAALDGAQARIEEIDKLLGDGGAFSLDDLEDRAKNWKAESLEHISNVFNAFATVQKTLGRQEIMSQDEFNKIFLEIADSVPTIDPNLIAELIGRMMILPETMTESTFQTEFNKMVAQNPFFGGIPISIVREAFKDNIGEDANKVTAELEQYINDLWSITDPAELRRALINPVNKFGKTIASMALDPAYEDAADSIKALMQKQAEMGDEIPLNLIEASLKDILDNMLHDATANITPMFSELATELQTLSIWGPQNYDAMAQAILGAVMPDGQNLLEAFAEGELPLGQAGLNLMEIAKNLVAEGIGGPELARIVEEAANTAGEDVGESVQRGLRSGLAEGLSRDKLTMKEVVDMGKLGSTAQQVHKAIMFLSSKVMQKAFSGNIQQRVAAQGEFNSITDVAIDRLMNADNRKGISNKRRNDIKNSVLRDLSKVIPALPPLFRQALRDEAIGWQAQGLISDAQLKKWFGITIDPADLIEFKAAPASEGLGGLAAVLGRGEEQGRGTWAESLTKNYGTDFVNGIKTSIAAADLGPVESAGEPAGRRAMAGARKAIREAKQVTGTTMSTAMVAASKQSANASLGGEEVGQAWADDVYEKIKGKSTGIGGAMSLTMWAASRSVTGSLGGSLIGDTWANAVVTSIENSKQKIADAAAEATEGIKPKNSPPGFGPLKHIDEWGENIGSGWGKKFRKGTVKEARKTASDVRKVLREGNGIGDSSFVSSNKKEINITVDVSSKDGSVDRMKTSELRRGLMEALALADIEHMVTIS